MVSSPVLIRVGPTFLGKNSPALIPINDLLKSISSFPLYSYSKLPSSSTLKGAITTGAPKVNT
jgi:hypothetical protein